MNKKILFKYVLIYLPVIVGISLFSNGVVNLFSSLLLFLGSHVAIKNTCDYRRIRKNKDVISTKNTEHSHIVKAIKSNKQKKCVCIKPINPENIYGFKRTKRYSKVRKRY